MKGHLSCHKPKAIYGTNRAPGVSRAVEYVYGDQGKWNSVGQHNNRKINSVLLLHSCAVGHESESHEFAMQV